MKRTVYSNEFINTMCSEDNGFSYEGAIALYDYFEELEEETGVEIEFDAIAIRCEFTEYENIEEVAKNYNNIETIDDLRDRTQVIEFEGGIIIQDF